MMLPRLFFVILLGFPIIELWVAVLVAQKIGWWLLLWFIVSAVLGINLIREQQFAVFGRVSGAFQRGEDPLPAVFATGRKMIAGLLLIFPGVVSDVLALLLLLWPGGRGKPLPPSDIIEGEYRREETIKFPRD